MPRPSMREQLIDAASDHFHEHGFNASGVKEITDAAGVPKGSFYNHFDSKESMAVEVMRRYASTRGMEMLADKSIAPTERIRGHFEYLAEDLAHFGYVRGCMLGNFGTELSTQSPTIRDEVDSSLERWSGLLASVLDEARAAGSLVSPVDSTVLARFLVSAWEGAAMRAKITRSRVPLEDFLKVFESLTV